MRTYLLMNLVLYRRRRENKLRFQKWNLDFLETDIADDTGAVKTSFLTANLTTIKDLGGMLNLEDLPEPIARWRERHYGYTKS